MSTGGCVAVRRKDGGWVGVYSHADSYPTRLGKEVWNHVRRKNLKQFAEDLLRFSTWNDYERKFERSSLVYITSDNPDPLFIEWVYVVDPERRVIDILVSQGSKKTVGPIRTHPILRDDGYWDYGLCAYKHIRIARVSLKKEPNWSLIESLPRKSLALEDTMDKDALVFRQLEGGEIIRSRCDLCGQTLLLLDLEAVHERCLRKVLKELGGDVDSWIRSLK